MFFVFIVQDFIQVQRGLVFGLLLDVLLGLRLACERAKLVDAVAEATEVDGASEHAFSRARGQWIFDSSGFEPVEGLVGQSVFILVVGVLRHAHSQVSTSSWFAKFWLLAVL